MKVNGTDYRTVWMEGSTVFMVEQNLLPFDFAIYRCMDYECTCEAIKTMIVRGAGAIGAAAGFAMAQAFVQNMKEKSADFLAKAKTDIEATRPTARNLFYAVDRVFNAGLQSVEHAIIEAQQIADEDAQSSRMIGQYGSELIHSGFAIETHCNAGWLAFVDYGTALSPIYTASEQGKEIFVYVDETRPRGQGARLTAWELANENIPHAIIPDNAGAHLMSLGKVDLMIVGADRIAMNGDVANKIGTLEKAIAAHYYGIPFYVAAPLSTFDPDCPAGNEIIIEERNKDEVRMQTGTDEKGNMHSVTVCHPGSKALNPAFDVTPASLITGIITERGIIKADEVEIGRFFG